MLTLPSNVADLYMWVTVYVAICECIWIHLLDIRNILSYIKKNDDAIVAVVVAVFLLLSIAVHDMFEKKKEEMKIDECR